jgi:hypothetical protein
MTDSNDQQTSPGDLRRGTLLTDQAQLAAIPPRSVVRAADGTIAARFSDELGVLFGDDRPFPWSVLRVPALVLWVDGDPLALPGQASLEAQR